MPTKGTYNRKYYLHRRIKAAGFGLHLEETQKTITIYPSEVPLAKEDKYVAELQAKYSYGVQILNPLNK